MPPRHPSQALVFLLAAFVTVSEAHAEEPAAAPVSSGQPRVLLVLYPAATGESLAQVISETLQWRLARAGLQVVVAPETPALPAGDERAILAEGRTRGCEFAVATTHRVESDRLYLTVDWYDVVHGQRSQSVSTTAPVDLDLDKKLIAAADSLIERVSSRIEEETEARAHRSTAEAAAARAQETSSPWSPVVAATPEPEAPAPEPTPTPDLPDHSTEVAVHPAVAPTQPAPDLIPPSEVPRISATPTRFVISLGAAPFFPVGKASDYFRVGFMPTLHGGVALALGDWRITLGLLIGAVLFHAEGAAFSSNNILLPAGPSVGLYRNLSGPLAFVTRLSGGVSAFIMQAEPSAPLKKLLPYAFLAAGFSAALGASAGVTVELGIAAFLEKTAPIIAYMPSVHLSLRN